MFLFVFCTKNKKNIRMFLRKEAEVFLSLYMEIKQAL